MTRTVTFPTPFQTVPQVGLSIGRIRMPPAQQAEFSVTLLSNDKTSFTMELKKVNLGFVTSMVVYWIASVDPNI